MRSLRFIFLAYLAWLLVLFLPAHTRGQITLGPRDGATTAPTTTRSCCDADEDHGVATTHPISKSPTSKDRANCAICFWAAGILPTAPFVFHIVLVEQSLERAHAYTAQVRVVACRLNQFGRDPPFALA